MNNVGWEAIRKVWVYAASVCEYRWLFKLWKWQRWPREREHSRDEKKEASLKGHLEEAKRNKRRKPGEMYPGNLSKC